MILNIDRIAPDQLAAIDSNGYTLTYGAICKKAQELQAVFAQRQLCFMLVSNTCKSMLHIMAAIASQRLVPLILNLHTDDTLLQNLVENYKPAFIYSDEKGLTPTRNASPALHPELSHLLPTSGSTGSPKLVRHKYENIEASALNISTFFELKPKDRPLLVLPLYYTMGLSVVFSHLKVGATILLTDCSMTDALFWKFFKEEHATSFTGVPYSYHILSLMRFFRMQLPDLELLTQGGGKMPEKLNRQFAEYCQSTDRRWIATYGQSECTARMAYLPAKWATEKIGSIGISVPNGELSLIDSNGNTITAPHTEGELCYRGKNVTMGYALCQDDLAKGDERNGFIRTGDLAYRDEDGCYYIVGRMGRFLKLFGMRIGLDECERIVESECEVECACVGNDEIMKVYINDAKKIQDVKSLLIQRLSLVATALDVVAIDNIPKNSTGKKLYSNLM